MLVLGHCIAGGWNVSFLGSGWCCPPGPAWMWGQPLPRVMSMTSVGSGKGEGSKSPECGGDRLPAVTPPSVFLPQMRPADVRCGPG